MYIILIIKFFSIYQFSHEFNQDRRHVVAPHLLACLLSHQRVQQILQNCRPIASRFPLVSDPRHHRLTVVHVLLPNAVAAHYDELVLWRPIDFTNIGSANDRLLVPVFLFYFFVVEVSKRPR